MLRKIRRLIDNVYGVKKFVVDEAAYRLHMMVVEECVFDRIEASHALSLFDIDQKYGDVVSLLETVETLQTLSRQE